MVQLGEINFTLSVRGILFSGIVKVMTLLCALFSCRVGPVLFFLKDLPCAYIVVCFFFCSQHLVYGKPRNVEGCGERQYNHKAKFKEGNYLILRVFMGSPHAWGNDTSSYICAKPEFLQDWFWFCVSVLPLTLANPLKGSPIIKVSLIHTFVDVAFPTARCAVPSGTLSLVEQKLCMFWPSLRCGSQWDQ